MSIKQYTQPLTPGDVLLSELRQISKDPATFQAGSAYVIGEVLGKVLLGAATAVAASGNTGTGTIAMDETTPILARAEVGTYLVVFTAATTFILLDPQGRQVGPAGVVGTAFANHLKFTITASATAFVAGDEFDITIAAGSGIVAPLAPSALDGTQHAAAVSLSALESSTSTQSGEIVARAAAVISGNLTWPDGITDAQKVAAITELEALGIVVRTNI
jgi:Bacteriophage lambda head decoration protein D